MPLPDEPNLVLPLASTINERGIAGYTHSVTNREDQIRSNVCYELSKNPMSGKGTLTLTKRPGVTADSSTYGVSTQTPYLAVARLTTGSITSLPMVFSINAAGDLTSSFPGTTTVIIATGTGYVPYTVDRTAISNVRNLVLQTRHLVSQAHRVFFSPDEVTWTEIVDPDFTNQLHVGKMEHMDGYAFIMDRTNLIWNSDVNSLANWVLTSFFAKQIKQDFPVGLAKYKNQLLAFGEKTVEVFYNGGNTTGSPLSRIPHLSEEIGLVGSFDPNGTHYYATVGSRIYFVGRYTGGEPSIGLFMFDGARFEKVSSPYWDKILSEKVQSIYSVNAVGHHGQAAVAVCFTAPSATTQQWLMYYPEWKELFLWSSDIFSPVNSGAWHLGVSSGNKNKVYSFPSTDNWQDAGTSYAWSTQFKLPTKGSNRNVLNMYGVDADTARSANNLTVEISRDDTQTWETLGTIDLTQDRKVLFRGGAFRHAHMRLGNTNSAETRLHNFLANVA